MQVKTSVLVMVGLMAVAGCGRKPRPVLVPVAADPALTAPARETIVKRDGFCTVVRNVTVRGPDVNGRPTYEQSAASGRPYAC